MISQDAVPIETLGNALCEYMCMSVMMSVWTHGTVALPAVRTLPAPSHVGKLGLVTKKGVDQGVSRSGTGGSTCSCSRASSASLVMLLSGAPAIQITL